MLAAAGALAGSVPGAAWAQAPRELGYLTAAQLAERCSDSSPASASYCFAYVAAVHDTARAYEVWLGQKEFCIPPATPQSELRRAFLTYITAYPSFRTGQAASAIVVALKESYPCLDAPAVRRPVPKIEPAPTKR